jgi:hypothetical protein
MLEGPAKVRVVNKGRPTLPNFLIIGAAKAGTTSLHGYLSLHPEIFMSKRKELNFFDDRGRWNKGIEWYKSNFNDTFSINGEASPQYSRYPRNAGVPERIKRVLGAPKLIYLIRDPVERIISFYAHMVQRSLSTPPFEELLAAIETDSEEYIQGSSYFLQLSQYLKLFPRDTILVVLQERLRADRRRTLKLIFKFLGVDDEFWSDRFNHHLNVAEAKRRIAPWFDALAPAALKTELRQPTWIPWTLNRAILDISRIGGSQLTKPRLSEPDDERLQKILKSDVESLRAFLGDPLPEWRPYA